MRSKLSKEQSDTENKILFSARDEFIEKGLGGGRMKSIAKRAGVNSALLHYYFRSKEKLYEATVHDILKTLWGTLNRNLHVEESIPLRQLIHTLVETYINTLKSNPDFARLFVREVADGGKHFPAIIQGLISSTGNLPARLIEGFRTGVQNPAFKSVDPVHVMINIFGMCAASFIVQPLISAMFENSGSQKAVFDDTYFEKRIQTITAMACDGLLSKEEKV